MQSERRMLTTFFISDVFIYFRIAKIEQLSVLIHKTTFFCFSGR